MRKPSLGLEPRAAGNEVQVGRELGMRSLQKPERSGTCIDSQQTTKGCAARLCSLSLTACSMTLCFVAISKLGCGDEMHPLEA